MTDALTASALFNGYVGSHVVYALHDLGVLARLTSEASVPVADLRACEQAGKGPSRFMALLGCAARLGLVSMRDGSVSLTATGRATAEMEGYFTWAVGGYGRLLLELAGLTRGDKVYGRGVLRDEGCIAVGSAEVDARFMTPILDSVLADIPFARVVDIGCGTASRLVRLCHRWPDVSAIGVDISDDACAIARRKVTSEGLADRIEVITADIASAVEAAEPHPAFRNVDLVMSFFMLHDLFDRRLGLNGLLARLRVAFPALRYLLVADTVLAPPEEFAADAPIFTLGFELVHQFMGVTVRSRAEYERAFEQAGFAIVRCEPFGAPSSWLYLLRPDKAAEHGPGNGSHVQRREYRPSSS